MNNDLISREALLNEIKNAQDKLKSDNDTIWEMNKGYFKGLAWANKIIIDTPAVDISGSEYFPYRTAYFNGVADGKATAIPQGKWIYLNKDDPMKVECPFCHERKCCVSNYCDNCGADMRKGEQNGN